MVLCNELMENSNGTTKKWWSWVGVLIFDRSQLVLCKSQQSYFNPQISPVQSMYERAANESRTSLTTNSSRAPRIVRKRDSNISTTVGASRSKNKQDQTNTSFEEYLHNQTKSMRGEHADNTPRDKGDLKTTTRLPEPTEKNDRSAGCSAPLTLSQTLLTLQLSRNSMIERGDRYIGHRLNSNLDNPQETREEKEGRQKKGKRRSPTPVRSKKQMASSTRTSEVRSNTEVLELQLRIAGLEEILSIERQQKEKVEAQLREQTMDIQNLKEVLSQVEVENKILQAEKRECEEKIDKLEKAILESETNLTAVQNNLNKLRQTIKENRLNELQAELKKCQRANESLKQQNSSSLKTINALNSKLLVATKELEEIRKFGDLQVLVAKQSMKEQYLEKELDRTRKEHQTDRAKCQQEKEIFLEQKLREQEQVIQELQTEVGRLLLRVHSLEYFRSKDVNDIKQVMEAEIKALRVKYSKMMVELKTKKVSQNFQTPKLSKTVSPLKSRNNYDIKCKCPSSHASSPTAHLSNQTQPVANEHCHGGTQNGRTEDSKSMINGSQQYHSNLTRSTWSCDKRGVFQDFCLDLSPQ